MTFRRSTIFPKKAPLTEKNLPDQHGKVFIVTGGSGGIGERLVSILFQRNAKVYIAARSEEKTESLINKVQKLHPSSNGELIFLRLTLEDLTSIKQSATEFLSKEARLDILWNNAGIMAPPAGSKTVQGYELMLGVNNLGHFLFTHFLTPMLSATAKTSPKNSVRVVWVSSSGADAAPVPAIDFSNMNYEQDEGLWVKYFRSKAGNVLHAAEFARREGCNGVISIALNPGNFVTGLQRSMPRMQVAIFSLIAHDPKKGAYTELYAGLSPDITEKQNGGWVSPFGKIEDARKDLQDSSLARKYWEWTEIQVKLYL